MEKDLKTIRILLGIILGFLIIYLLAVLKTIVIPLVLAIYLGLLLQPLISWLIRKKVPKGLAVILTIASAMLVIVLVSDVILEASKSFYDKKHLIAEDIRNTLGNSKGFIQKYTGVVIDEDQPLSKVFGQLISFEWLKKSSASVAANLGNTTFSFIIMVIYLIAVIGGIVGYKDYLKYLSAGDEARTDRYITAFENIRNAIISYIKVKTIVSLGTGICFWIACIIFDIRFAAFWGFLAFILNYIPTFGSVVATVPPALLGLIHIDHLGMFFLFLGILLFIQIIFGNYVEPRMHGARLALNTATVLFGLIFWGYLWGAVGLLLSVPLMVLFRLILMQLPNSHMAARIMGRVKDGHGLEKEIKQNP